MEENLSYSNKLKQLKLKNTALTPPALITEDDKQSNPIFAEIAKGYEDAADLPKEIRSAHSLIHYLLRENKSLIVLSTARVKEVYLEDPNWLEKDNFEYGDLRHTYKTLDMLGVKRIVNSKDYNPGIFMVTTECEIEPFLTGDVEEQIRTAFKEAKVTEDRFVDENIKNRLKKFLH